MIELKMSKLLYLDIETTGIHPLFNGIVELAVIIEIDGKIAESHHWKIKPFESDRISASALEIIGVTIDEINTYEDPNKVYWKLIKILEKYVNKFDKDKANKFYPIGYNVQFDLDFLKEFFVKNGDKYIGSWFTWKKLDVLQLLYWMHYKNEIALDSYKLDAVCKHFGIELIAHNAMNDIIATRELFKKLEDSIMFISQENNVNSE